MRTNLKFFKKSKFLPVDKFFYNVLYDKKFGYYNSTIPFGPQGDFVTSPNISNLFSEMIAIWIISTWELFGKPKKINVVELGPGDGSLVKVLIEVFKRFPEFNLAKRIYLFDESKLLKKFQKKKLKILSIGLMISTVLKVLQLFFLEMNFLMLSQLNNLSVKRIFYLKEIFF